MIKSVQEGWWASMRYLPLSSLLWFPWLYLLLVPSADLILGSHFAFYDQQRLLEVILLAITALLLGVDSASRKTWLEFFSGLPRLIKGALGLFCLLGAVSATFVAPLPKYAWQELSLFALLFVLAVAIAAQIRHHGERLRLFLIAAIFAGVVLIVWQFLLDYAHCLFHYGSVCQGFDSYFYRFVHIRFFNQLQTWTFPILALPFLFCPKRLQGWRVLLFLPAAFWWALWIYSAGRGTGLATVAGAVVVVIIFRWRAWPWLSFQGLSFLAGVGFYSVLFYLMPLVSGSGRWSVWILNRSIMSAEEERPDLWSATLNMALAHPWLGAGPQQYAFFHPYRNIAHPHSISLQLLAEWGVPAFVSFMFVLIFGFLAWVGIVARRGDVPAAVGAQHIPVALTASFVGGLLHAQLCGLLVMPMSQIFGVVIIGMMLSFAPKQRSPAAIDGGRLQPMAFVMGVFALVAVLLWSLFPEVSDLSADRARYVQYHPGEVYHPRFWSQGLIDWHGPGLGRLSVPASAPLGGFAP